MRLSATQSQMNFQAIKSIEINDGQATGILTYRREEWSFKAYYPDGPDGERSFSIAHRPNTPQRPEKYDDSEVFDKTIVDKKSAVSPNDPYELPPGFKREFQQDCLEIKRQIDEQINPSEQHMPLSYVSSYLRFHQGGLGDVSESGPESVF